MVQHLFLAKSIVQHKASPTNGPALETTSNLSRSSLSQKCPRKYFTYLQNQWPTEVTSAIDLNNSSSKSLGWRNSDVSVLKEILLKSNDKTKVFEGKDLAPARKAKTISLQKHSTTVHKQIEALERSLDLCKEGVTRLRTAAK